MMKINEQIGDDLTALIEDLVALADSGSHGQPIKEFEKDKILNFRTEFGAESGTEYGKCSECSDEESIEEDVDLSTNLCRVCYETRVDPKDKERDLNEVEIYEWIKVESELAKKLIAKKEAVLVNIYGNFWGRQTKMPIEDTQTIIQIMKGE